MVPATDNPSLRGRDLDPALEAWRFLWTPLRPAGDLLAAAPEPSVQHVGVPATALVMLGIGAAPQGSLPDAIGAYRQNAE